MILLSPAIQSSFPETISLPRDAPVDPNAENQGEVSFRNPRGIIASAEVVDEQGNPVDPTLLEPPEPVIQLPDDLTAIPVDDDEVGETDSSVADSTDGEEE